MILNRITFVVANNQHLPLLFWFVTGPVLKSTTLLKICWSVILAERDDKTVLMSLCERIVLASCTFEFPEAALSQEAM
jgi:hypothetical protein